MFHNFCYVHVWAHCGGGGGIVPPGRGIHNYIFIRCVVIWVVETYLFKLYQWHCQCSLQFRTAWVINYSVPPSWRSISHDHISLSVVKYKKHVRCKLECFGIFWILPILGWWFELLSTKIVISLIKNPVLSNALAFGINRAYFNLVYHRNKISWCVGGDLNFFQNLQDYFSTNVIYTCKMAIFVALVVIYHPL